ncbi:hypothetical protein QTP86_016322, partial [Hemibagrus guttatus]
SLKVCCGIWHQDVSTDPLNPIGDMSQSNIYMDGRTQGFPAEHCPKHDTDSAGLPSSHSASWCHVFPRTSINIFSNLSKSVGSEHMAGHHSLAVHDPVASSPPFQKSNNLMKIQYNSFYQI